MFDSHAHLTDEKFADDLPQVVERAFSRGVRGIATIGTDVGDSRAALELAERFDGVVAAVGIHPHSAGSAAAAGLEAVRELAGHPRAAAIGETGLDFHYDFSPRDVQRRVFARQLEMAHELDLPVVVHSREADADLIAMLRDDGGAARGVLHSFSGGRDLLETGIQIGWYVSFSGMLTFKKFEGDELLRAVPLDRLLFETDSPYLAPVPHRGRRNEPAYVTEVVARAAQILGMSAEELEAISDRNARAFYALEG